MLLRDLKLKPRAPDNRYWLAATVDLKDGTVLCIQQPTEVHTDYRPHTWFIVHGADYFTGITWHNEIDEFEAQAVLDHYLQTIGPSDDPTLESK
jgi:hypothetical protein